VVERGGLSRGGGRYVNEPREVLVPAVLYVLTGVVALAAALTVLYFVTGMSVGHSPRELWKQLAELNEDIKKRWPWL